MKMTPATVAFALLCVLHTSFFISAAPLGIGANAETLIRQLLNQLKLAQEQMENSDGIDQARLLNPPSLHTDDSYHPSATLKMDNHNQAEIPHLDITQLLRSFVPAIESFDDNFDFLDNHRWFNKNWEDFHADNPYWPWNDVALQNHDDFDDDFDDINLSQCTLIRSQLDQFGQALDDYSCPGPSPCTQIIAKARRGKVYMTFKTAKKPCHK